jgi:hypothetical protein
MERFTRNVLQSTGVAVCLLLSATSGRAQETDRDRRDALPLPGDSISLVSGLPEASRVTLVAWQDPTASDDNAPKPRALDRKFSVVGTALVGAMITDTYSTFESFHWCPKCQETNPYAAPFIHRGPVVAYTAGILFDTAILGISAKMRTHYNPALRKIWWLPSALLVVGHSLAIQHNYQLRQVCQHNPRCGPSP